MPAQSSGGAFDFYRIAVRQFQQHILPPQLGLPPTTVWSYGAFNKPGTIFEGGSYFYPAFTVEARWNRTVQVTGSTTWSTGSGATCPTCCPSTRRCTGPTRPAA
jgi:hypothetical protein